MHSFIALAKKSNLQTANSGTLSVDDKQQPQRDNSKLFSKFMDVKCHPLFRPKFSKVKIRFVVETLQVSDTLTLNVGVSGDTPV